jgi:hypothetical protein
MMWSGFVTKLLENSTQDTSLDFEGTGRVIPTPGQVHSEAYEFVASGVPE